MIGETPSEEMAETELCIESSPMWPEICQHKVVGEISEGGNGALTVFAVDDNTIESCESNDLGMSYGWDSDKGH